MFCFIIQFFEKLLFCYSLPIKKNQFLFLLGTRSPPACLQRLGTSSQVTTSQQMWHVSPLKSSHHYSPLSVSLTPAQRQPFTSSPLTPSKSLVWDLFHCSISAAFLDSWALPDAQSYSSIASNIGVITLIGYPGAGASLQGSESHETCSIRNRSTFWLLINGLSIHHRQLVCSPSHLVQMLPWVSGS